jgi:hypothetical protein
MFTICAAMEWKHLPVAGGLYDQSPAFMDDMLYIMQEKAIAEERKREKEKKQNFGGQAAAPRRSRRR